MKVKILILSLIFTLIACQQKPEVNVEKEKEEIVQFLKDYSTFVNKNSIEGFQNYWWDSDETSYIPLERDSLIVGFKNIKEYFENQINEISSVQYASWNPIVWVNPTKSEAIVVFLSAKKIQFKNGFTLNLSPIRNSATLTKFQGQWKLVNHHESVRQK